MNECYLSILTYTTLFKTPKEFYMRGISAKNKMKMTNKFPKSMRKN